MARISNVLKIGCEAVDLTEYVTEISFLSKEENQLKQLDEKYENILAEIVNK